jgi:hypothetical protein
MDVVSFARHVYKLIAEREEDISSMLASGAPKDWEQYQSMVGEIRGLSFVSNEIRSLLENHTDDDESLSS